jgi:S-formylglutathione hydrolase FrmB
MPRRTTLLLIGSLLLAGCDLHLAADVATATPTASFCTESGTVHAESVDDGTDIRVYLPPCFDANRAEPYPVAYLFPGFSGTADNMINGRFADMADIEILVNGVPPFLAVSTDDLYPDINAGGFRENILPWVEARYPAGGDRLLRTAAGGSFGGAAAYHLVFQHSNLFASAGIFSNGAAFGEEETILAWLAAVPAGERPRVFLNVGEEDTYMLERARVMVSLLDTAGVSHHEIFGPGGHDYETWLAAFPTYLEWIAQDWRAADAS